MIDIRLNYVSPLAGFDKKDDLSFFLEAIAGIEYLDFREMAPMQELLNAYRKRKGDLAGFERNFGA